MNIKIGKTLIGNNNKSFIIAEMSGNHNSSLNEAIKINRNIEQVYANLGNGFRIKKDFKTWRSKRSTLVLSIRHKKSL